MTAIWVNYDQIFDTLSIKLGKGRSKILMNYGQNVSY